MGKIKPNGQLSGGVGNVVFVQSGDKTYVRSKPTTVKQSTATKQAASSFGKISAADKVFRQRLLQLLPIATDSKYAYRHRSRFAKMMANDTENTAGANTDTRKTPQAMVGFDFNLACEWHKVCRFFPEYVLDPDNRLTVTLPALVWKRDLKPIEKSKNIALRFYVLAVDMNPETEVPIEICAEFGMDLPAETTSNEMVWTTEPLPTDKLLFVVGLCTMDFNRPDKYGKTGETAACYLWASGG